MSINEIRKVIPAARFAFAHTQGQVEGRRNSAEVAALPHEYRSQAARGETSPRRYVGQASPGTTQARPRGGAPISALPGREHTPATTAEARTSPWSMRLVLAVGLLLGLLAFLRLPGLWTPPVDTPVGVEATHAAFARLLSGQVGGSLEPLRAFPPPPAWYGAAPVDPAGGLPVFGWLAAAATGTLGLGDWAGRGLALLFYLLAGFTLFSLVRLAAGARAGLYSLLFFALSPLGILLGQQYSPASLMLFTNALALLALYRWRLGVSATRPQGSVTSFAFALVAGGMAAAIDPGAIFLLVPAAYLVIGSEAVAVDDTGPLMQLGRRTPEPSRGWKRLWATSPRRGKFIGYAAASIGAVICWRLMMSGAGSNPVLGAQDGGAGIGGTISALVQGGTYVQIIGIAMGKLLTIIGALLLFAGVLRGARRPWYLIFHAWGLAALIHVLVDASRIGRHDDVLLPLLLPACAFVGIGAAWAGSLPARAWLAVAEQRRDSDDDYTVSPQTSWLLDLPEAKKPETAKHRPQAQLAFGRTVAEKAHRAGAESRKAWMIGLGNGAVLAAFAIMSLSGWNTVQARLQPSVESIEIAEAGKELAGATTPGSRLIVVGDMAPQIFYGADRTGWVVNKEDFSLGEVQNLQHQGAAYLVSTDQEWLGHQTDYVGLLTQYSVARLGHRYILFDLNTKPAANDRLYFLQSGHTLGGEFRRFWEKNGDVRKLGYPISEEVEQINPLDGQQRRVQYFERAVLEYHSENAGKENAVMLAAVGRWATLGRDFPTVPPFTATDNRWYFKDTGHSVKEQFLKTWQREGGVAIFGYPISEEMPEINPADGKVYTVQYFERARLEWHPTEAGTPGEVQLGLIGKQVWEQRR